MRPDNTRFLIQAAHQRSQATRQRAIQALRDLAAASDPITFQTIARTAGVSRSWLYAQPDPRAELERLRALSTRAPTSPPVPAQQRATDASLRRRPEAVNAEIRRLRTQNHQLRQQLARALGQRRAAVIRPSKHNGSVTIGPCS